MMGMLLRDIKPQNVASEIGSVVFMEQTMEVTNLLTSFSKTFTGLSLAFTKGVNIQEDKAGNPQILSKVSP